MSDDELYRQYLNGDASAGDQLMLRYADTLTAYLDGFLHNAHDAEDLMLDCFTVILVNRPSISEGHFRACLFKMARNMANREQAALQAQAEEVSAAVRGRTDGSGSNQTQPRQLQRPPEPRPHLEAVQKNV